MWRHATKKTCNSAVSYIYAISISSEIPMRCNQYFLQCGDASFAFCDASLLFVSVGAWSYNVSDPSPSNVTPGMHVVLR